MVRIGGERRNCFLIGAMALATSCSGVKLCGSAAPVEFGCGAGASAGDPPSLVANSAMENKTLIGVRVEVKR